MIETPPVLNFEEIDYKEIEVEEVSAGPAAGWPLPTHTRPRSPGAACRRAGREPGWPPRAAGVAVPPRAEGAAGAPWVCRDTPPPPQCTCAGGCWLLRWMLQRLAPEDKGGVAGSGGASLLLPTLVLCWGGGGGGYLSGVDLLRTRKFRRPFCHPALVRAANAVVKRCHKGQLLILMFLSDLCFCMPPPLAPPATEPNCRIYNHRTGVNYLLNLQLC